MKNRVTATVTAAIATACVGLLAACSNPDSVDTASEPASDTASAPASSTSSATAPTSTAEETAQETSTTSAPASTAAPDSSAVEAAPHDADCAVDTQAAEIYDNLDKLPANSYGWEYLGETNYNPCQTLTWATVLQAERGNAQYGTQLMLFHNGEFLGVGSDPPQQHTVIDSTEDSVTVRFKDYEALDAAGGGFADSPNYTEDVTFQWDGTRVVPIGRIPGSAS
ncbi:MULTISPECIES: LppP/LprE family lipoprotein [unclassified Corynebacterium]|uniref:LppP/LprE family lipoprotein n=1 Tax=unclassified Corynebacterium TaxID=2624378 RepID=UPI0034CDAF8C